MADNQGSAEGHCHSDDAINYQRRQLPTQSTLSRLEKEWDEAFPNLPTPTVKRRDHQLANGLTNVLSWEFNRDVLLNGSHVDYDEFGYDDRGYVCKLHVDSRDHEGALARAGDGDGGALSQFAVDWPTGDDETPALVRSRGTHIIEIKEHMVSTLHFCLGYLSDIGWCHSLITSIALTREK